jgi:hypothetical protein
MLELLELNLAADLLKRFRGGKLKVLMVEPSSCLDRRSYAAQVVGEI